MNLWNGVTSTAGFVLRTTRSTLRWGESVVPWPLSLVPRTLRLPLDVGALFVDASPLAGGREARPPAPGASRQAQAHPPATRTQATPAPAERTANIAGTRSDGADDTPRYDREFRARLAPLYTRDAGSGPTVVLLHAFPLNGRMWEPQLEALVGRFRIVAPDFAGFGLSLTPDAPYSIEDHAHAVALTLDDLQVDEMVLVGLSMGGYVAFPLLEQLGRRVRGLVLASTRATPDTEAAASERHRLAAEVEADGVEVAASELLPKLLGTSTLIDQPELVEWVHALMLENSETGVANALRAMASRPDSTPFLRRIDCPVLILAGEEDTVIGIDAARAMGAKIKNSRLEVLPGGHLSNLEASDDFNREIEDFARTLPSMVRRPAMTRARAAHAG